MRPYPATQHLLEPVLQAEPVPDFPCKRSESGPKVISVARALGVTLADINPGAAFPISAPTPFTSHTPAPGTFAVPGDADSAAADLSVPQYGTSDVLSGADCRGRGETEICFDTPGLFSGFTGPLAWCKQPNSFGVFGLGSESDGTTCPFGNGCASAQHRRIIAYATHVFSTACELASRSFRCVAV